MGDIDLTGSLPVLDWIAEAQAKGDFLTSEFAVINGPSSGTRTPQRCCASVLDPLSASDSSTTSESGVEGESEAEAIPLVWSSCEMRSLERTEPLLQENPDRFSLFPIQ